MITRNKSLLLCLIILVSGCAGHSSLRKDAPPADPIATTSASLLHDQGLAFAARGDLIRSQQYLEAAKLKGFDSRVVVPELIKVCVMGSRLRAALLYGEPYLRRNPQDSGMNYVVGTIYLTLGNLQKAASYFRRALAGDWAMVDAAFSLAQMAVTTGSVGEQRKYLGYYLRESPTGRYAKRARRMLAELSEEPQTVSTVGTQSLKSGHNRDF